jgi:hypothetical protein
MATRALSMLLAAALLLATTPALAGAGGPHRGGGSGQGLQRSFRHPGRVVRHVPPKSVFPIPADPWKSWGVPPPRRHDRRHLGSFFIPGFAGTTVVTAASASAVNVNEIAYAPPSAAAIAGPVAPPTPLLVEYETGWYQLRGDGVTAPYVWVWIPRAPVAPPEPPALERKPEPAPPSGAEPSARPETGRRPEPRMDPLRWTDDEGVTTWTNRLDRVPRRYRDQVLQNDADSR